MYIAPNFTDEDWKNLDLDGNEEDWQSAINALEDRINSRYIEPVDQLIELEKDVSHKDKRYGFTCLAIDMLLIETFQAFKEGLPDSKGRSKSLFTKFLMESQSFSHYFKNEKECNELYEQFRCGILHQAEVQGPVLLWSVGDLIERDANPPTLNRVFFNRELKKEFENYIGLLRNPKSTDLRKAFRAKIESIADRSGS
ncbi:hypothetical protein JL49_02310 [Pseudoalteromonas luteoviolacea]|nr:hypothetical protein JL49_02310 [Pseudoalteromonas luteoviolacea]